MTIRVGAAVAAGFLALGIVVGAAGTIVVVDATGTDFDAHMGAMKESSGSMGSMAGMMSMMDAGDMAGMMSMMGSNSQMRPDASMAPGEHGSHHAISSPEATR